MCISRHCCVVSRNWLPDATGAKWFLLYIAKVRSGTSAVSVLISVTGSIGPITTNNIISFHDRVVNCSENNLRR